MEFILNDEKYVTLDDVEKLVDMKETSIYNRVRFGHFPKPLKIKIGMAWKKSDIDAYIKSKQISPEKTREPKKGVGNE
jgi:predicted DNA-binding transcriptional regulator AlpA